MSTILANPNGAHRTVSDYTTGRDDDGFPLVYGNQEVESWQAGATILVGQALMFVAPTATAPMTVIPMTAAVTTSDPWRFAGAALEGASSGDMVKVLVKGFGEVLFDTSNTAAAYSVLSAPGTTTGEFDVATDPVDNSVNVGVCYGAEISTEDKCLAYVNRDGINRRFEAGA